MPSLISSPVPSSDTYYPAPEVGDGWRRCRNDEDIRSKAGMDPQRLNLIGQTHAQLYGGPWAIAIVKNGYIVREWFGTLTLPNTTFDVWSCTKSMTAIAFGLLFEDSRNGKLPGEHKIDLESAAYDFIPEGLPLTDPRKSEIKLKHLLSMTSGIPGESLGSLVLPVAEGCGEFEFALGKEPSRYGASAGTLTAEPDKVWDYSDAAYAHLALIFARVAGREIRDFVEERIFEALGIRNVGWDFQGGSGHIGPHTSAGIGLHLSSRDLARVGYLMAHRGRWEGKQLVPEWWIELATQSSQQVNSSYGYGFWVARCAQGCFCFQRVRRESVLRGAVAGPGRRTTRLWAAKLVRGCAIAGSPGSHRLAEQCDTGCCMCLQRIWRRIKLQVPQLLLTPFMTCSKISST
jgi:CubicO group peptidase (beta-lactamase class C family)